MEDTLDRSSWDGSRTRRAAASSLVLVIGLCACRPAPLPALPARPSVVTAAPPPPAIATPAAAGPAEIEEPPVALPPPIARPPEVACSWTSDRWLSSSPIDLRLRPKGPVFARASGGPRAHVEIPVGPHDHGIADVTSGGLVLTGVVDDSAITLYSTHPFPMNGVLYPQSTVPLSWTAGLAGKVSVTAALPKEIMAARSPLAGTTECSNVGLDRGPAIAMNQALFGLPNGSTYYLPSGRQIEVFSDPARPAEVKLFLAESATTDAFSSAGAFSHVSLQVDQMFIAGWVRTSHLREAHGRGGLPGFGYGYAGLVDLEHSPLAKVVCPASVPVAAEAGGETATVGSVLPGATIEILERRGLFSRVFVRSRGVHVAHTIALLARASDLAACSPVKS